MELFPTVSDFEKKFLKNTFSKTSCPALNELHSYRIGQISHSEQLRIERHLLDCDICSTILEGLEKNGDSIQFDEIEHQLKVRLQINLSKTKSYPTKWLSVAAILFSISTAFFLKAHFLQTDLFREFYKPYPVELQTFRGDSDKSKLSYSLRIYKTGGYEEAIPWLLQIVEHEPENLMAKFYLANAYLALNDIEKAKLSFYEIYKIFDSNYADQTRWYLALICIREGENEKAIKLLNQIKQNDDLIIKVKDRLLEKLQTKNK